MGQSHDPAPQAKGVTHLRWVVAGALGVGCIVPPPATRCQRDVDCTRGYHCDMELGLCEGDRTSSQTQSSSVAAKSGFTGSAAATSLSMSMGSRDASSAGAVSGGPSGEAASSSLGSATTGIHQATSLIHGNYTFDVDTVMDSGTGLTWQRAVSPESYTWVDARMYCAGISLAGPAPWRLPWLGELQTIVDLATGPPTINQNAFPNTPALTFWSASPFVSGSNVAWYVNFNDGDTNGTFVTSTLRVRCAR